MDGCKNPGTPILSISEMKILPEKSSMKLFKLVPFALEGSCPDNFIAKAGGNSGFMSAGGSRQFHVFLPETLDTPRPLFIALTGTMATELKFVSDDISRFESLVDSGWIVVAPIRRCTSENRSCFGIGLMMAVSGSPGLTAGCRKVMMKAPM